MMEGPMWPRLSVKLSPAEFYVWPGSDFKHVGESSRPRGEEAVAGYRECFPMGFQVPVTCKGARTTLLRRAVPLSTQASRWLGLCLSFFPSAFLSPSSKLTSFTPHPTSQCYRPIYLVTCFLWSLQVLSKWERKTWVVGVFKRVNHIIGEEKPSPPCWGRVGEGLGRVGYRGGGEN